MLKNILKTKVDKAWPSMGLIALIAVVVIGVVFLAIPSDKFNSLAK